MEYVDKIFKMDNFELLRELPDEAVDLIYCDILYNTGRNFKDFSDKLGSVRDAVDWYRPRLVEMKRVLKGDGSIYIQCDSNLVHYLKVVMDGIFGYDNFQRDIIWRIGWVSGYKSMTKNWIRNHDNILFYVKDRKNYKFNKQYLSYDDFYVRRDTDESDREGVPMEDVWNCSEADELNSIQIISFSKEKVGYDTQKPKDLMRRIIKASSNKGDIVADFFCGSGTTCVVARELGRKFIGCDINGRAVEITEKRLVDEVGDY